MVRRHAQLATQLGGRPVRPRRRPGGDHGVRPGGRRPRQRAGGRRRRGDGAHGQRLVVRRLPGRVRHGPAAPAGRVPRPPHQALRSWPPTSPRRPPTPATSRRTASRARPLAPGEGDRGPGPRAATATSRSDFGVRSYRIPTRTNARVSGYTRERYVERPPTASLLRRLDRWRPSRTSSTALATTAGLSSPPDRRRPARAGPGRPRPGGRGRRRSRPRPCGPPRPRRTPARCPAACRG